MSAHIEHVADKLRELSPQRLAEVEDFVDFLRLREEKTRAHKVDELFATMDRLAAVEPRMTEAEIEAEIAAARAERRAGKAGSNADRR